jgi:hypothetical protein
LKEVGSVTKPPYSPYWAYIGFVYKIGVISVSHIRSV